MSWEEQLARRIGPILFRLEWQEAASDGRTVRCFGTGFFIREDGLALTAFHNLPREVRGDEETPGDPGLPLRARFGDREIELFWHLTGGADRAWQDKIDVAVLRGPSDCVSRKNLVPLTYFAEQVPTEQRSRRWDGKHIQMLGYPRFRGGLTPFPLGGNLWNQDALETVKIQEPERADGTPGRIREMKDVLAFAPGIQAAANGLRGMSGAPVYYPQQDRVIGVQIGGHNTSGLYACELYQVARYWPEFRSLPAAEEIAVAMPAEPASLARRRRWPRVLRWLAAGAAALALVPAGRWLRDNTRVDRLPPPPPRHELRLEFSLYRGTPPGDPRDEIAVPAEYPFSPGEPFRFHVQPAADGYLYLVSQETSGYRVLFPSPSGNGGSSYVIAAKPTPVPGLSFLHKLGGRHEDRIWMIWSIAAVPELEALGRYANDEDRGRITNSSEAARLEEILHSETPQAVTVSHDDDHFWIGGNGWLLIQLVEL